MGMTTDELYFKRPPSSRQRCSDCPDPFGPRWTCWSARASRSRTRKPWNSFARAGARVNGDRVKIPGWLVEDAIRKAPSRIVLAKRDR